MRYYIIAGEASGDLHSSNLMKELKKIDHDADFRCWGGDLMEEQGGVLVKHYRELAFMGFAEVLMNIRTISKNMKLCRNDLSNYNPDVVILVDYPGFNLRIARFAKDAGFKVFYYISPQVWAWKQSRVKKIKQFVDRMFVILPFEKDFYKQFDYDVDFEGHPLLDAIELKQITMLDKGEFLKKNALQDKPIIAILPGSRKQEIKVKLPIMLSLVDHYKDYLFVIAGAPSLDEAFYKEVADGTDVAVLFGQTYDIMHHAVAAMVTSGTATLETALLKLPEVVCYRAGGNLSYYLAKKLIKVRFISLVNLIMDREIVKELIHFELTTENLKKELDKILFNETYREIMYDNYRQLKEKLGGSGASARVASRMIEALNKV